MKCCMTSSTSHVAFDGLHHACRIRHDVNDRWLQTQPGNRSSGVWAAWHSRPDLIPVALLCPSLLSVDHLPLQPVRLLLQVHACSLELQVEQEKGAEGVTAAAAVAGVTAVAGMTTTGADCETVVNEQQPKASALTT